MADITALENRIRSLIKTNGNQEITGAVAQQILLDIADSLNTYLEAVVSDCNTAVSNLNTAILNEALTRSQNDNTETTNRQNADNALHLEIGAEAQARQDADNALSGRIDNEAQARESGDRALRDLLAEGYLFGGVADVATNPGTPYGRIFYLTAEAGTFMHFKNSDNESLVFSTAAIRVLYFSPDDDWQYQDILSIASITSQLAYVECDTEGNIAAKIIALNDYELLSGGSLKVKFLNKNTANNVTLNINSKGAKALYYHGKRVSSSNTWEANEVVEIYYDGTNYQANNVTGNSGDGIFDVCVYNNTEYYDSLSDALGGNNISQRIPLEKRKPGMNIKFNLRIQTGVDGNNEPVYSYEYMQYRYMLADVTDAKMKVVENWQGIDDEPTADSKNLVKSGGVSDAIFQISQEIESSKLTFEKNKLYSTVLGTLGNGNGYISVIPRTTINEKSIIELSENAAGFYFQYINCYDSNGVYLGYYTVSSRIVTCQQLLNAYQNTKTVGITARLLSLREVVDSDIVDVVIQIVNNDALIPRVTELETEVGDFGGEISSLDKKINGVNIPIPLAFGVLWSTVNGNRYPRTSNRIGSDSKFELKEYEEVVLNQTVAGEFRIVNICLYSSIDDFSNGIPLAQSNPYIYGFKCSDIIASYPTAKYVAVTISKFDPNDAIVESEMSNVSLARINNYCLETRVKNMEDDSTINIVGLKICATGDSIMAGAENNPDVLSFAKIIADKYNMTLQNIAVGGGSILNIQDRFNIPNSLANLDTDGDYYLFDGGVNDSSLGVPLGSVTSNFDVDLLDMTTFAGSLEKFLYNIVTTLAGKKVLYVIVHKMTSEYTGIYNNPDFYTITKAALNKWGVPYIDLNAEVPPIRYIDALKNVYTRNQDGWHPNKLGYNTFYVPKIVAKMKTL